MIQLLFREQTQCVWLCRVYPLDKEKQRTSRRLLHDLKKSIFFVDAKTLQCCLVRGRKHLKTIRRKLLASSSSLSSVVYLSAALVSQASFSKKGSSVFLKTDCKCCLSEFGEVSCSARECCFFKHYQKIKKYIYLWFKRNKPKMFTSGTFKGLFSVASRKRLTFLRVNPPHFLHFSQTLSTFFSFLVMACFAKSSTSSPPAPAKLGLVSLCPADWQHWDCDRTWEAPESHQIGRTH